VSAPGSATREAPRGALGRLGAVLAMIAFPHTLFALPFALLGTMLAAREASPPGWPGWRALALILGCMVTARSAAMAYNRLVDHRLDAANPRTAGRHLPAGLVSRAWVGGFVVVNAALFMALAGLLGPLPGRLAPLALLWLLGYSHAKRFTAASHFWLGLSLAIAPIGAWVALRGTLAGAPWLLALAVLLWVAGFDLIYALQDAAFDRARGLHALPARLGPAGTLRLAALCHLGMLAALALLGVQQGLGLPWRGGLLLAAILLIWEHRIVRGGDLARIDLAFFRINSWVGVLIFLAGGLAILLD
jgi:4-hydroxybenzoate polyprenyltransferase